MTETKNLICLACYQDRLASVFDNASEYRLYETDQDNHIYPAGRLSLPSKDPMDRTSAIMACGVTCILCGAVCDTTRKHLERGGIAVHPWLTGTIDETLRAYLQGSLADFAMPGCRNCGERRSPAVVPVPNADAGQERD